jgi:hypothetical protein
VPEGFIPKEDAASKVIVINTGDEKVMYDIADEMKEEEEWIVGPVGDRQPEFPKAEINQEANAIPTDVPPTTVKSTTTETDTSETPTTTTTTPTSSTETTSESTSTTSPVKKKHHHKHHHHHHEGEKIEVKRDLGNMAHSTTGTESQQVMTTSPAPSSSSTSTTTEARSTSQQADQDSETESPEKPLAESLESQPTDTQNISESGGATSATPTTSQTVSQDLTQTPKTETPGTRVPDVSKNPDNKTKNSTAAASKADKDSYQIHGHHKLDTVVVENNELPEEFWSDDGSENSIV